MQLLYGMRRTPDSAFIPFRRLSSRYSNHEGLVFHYLGPFQHCPTIIENRSDADFAIGHLKWSARSITAHPGPEGEEAVIRFKATSDGHYVLVVRPEPQGLGGKPTSTSLGVNGTIVWRSAYPDVFVGDMSLKAGDKIDIAIGLLPFSDFTDTTTTVRFGFFLKTADGRLVCLDDKRSGFSEDDIADLLARENRLSVTGTAQSVVRKSWHRQVFNTMMRYDDKKHVEACFSLPFHELFDYLSERNVPPGKKYVILFTPRSGSSLLTECISQMDGIGKPLEYFVEHLLPFIFQLADASTDSITNLLTSKFSSDNGVFGVEIDYNRFFDAEEPIIEDIENWSVFYMTRQNLLAQAISLHCSTKFGVWNINSIDAAVPQYDRSSIIYSLVVLARTMQEFEKYFNIYAIKPKRIVYEDFLADIDGTLRSIAETLDVDPAGLRPVDLAKTAQRKLDTGDRLLWAYDILTRGGNYKGYNLEKVGSGVLAVLSGAESGDIERPQDYQPLAFLGDSEADVKGQIDQYIGRFAL